MKRIIFIKALGCLLVPALARGSVPLPFGFWKPASAAGPSETPASYSGLQVWYRSSDLSLNDGDPVGTWADRSGNANDATAAGSARPTFKTAIIGSTPVLRFDGSANGLSIGTALSYGINPTMTLMALLKPSSSGGVYCGSSGGVYFYMPDQRLIYSDTVNTDTSDNFTSLTTFKLATVRRNSSNVIYRENKTARGTHNIGNTGSAVDRIGRYSGGALFNGDYVEFAAWNVSLSDAQCDSLYDNYFKFLYPTLP